MAHAGNFYTVGRPAGEALQSGNKALNTREDKDALLPPASRPDVNLIPWPCAVVVR